MSPAAQPADKLKTGRNARVAAPAVHFLTLKQVSERFHLPVSTLRYYDKEGFFDHLPRSAGGIRLFGPEDLRRLRVIECLKHSGLSLLAIREFLNWCKLGDASLQQRRELFVQRLEDVDAQIEALQQLRKNLLYKKWYYDTAIAAGTEKGIEKKEVPDDLKDYVL